MLLQKQGKVNANYTYINNKIKYSLHENKHQSKLVHKKLNASREGFWAINKNGCVLGDK